MPVPITTDPEINQKVFSLLVATVIFAVILSAEYDEIIAIMSDRTIKYTLCC